MTVIRLQQLRAWYRDAWRLRTTHRYAAMIVELCLEVERLKQIADEQNSEYSDYTLMTFGKYGKPPEGPKKLADVPNEYLEWWFNKNSDRNIIILEMDHGPFQQRAVAIKKLRLHDYIKRKQRDAQRDGLSRTLENSRDQSC